MQKAAFGFYKKEVKNEKSLVLSNLSSLYYSTSKTDKTDNLRIFRYVTMTGFSDSVLRVSSADGHRNRRPRLALNIVPAQE